MINDFLEELVFCDAEPEQLDYIRRYYMDQWRQQQEEEIERLIEAYVKDNTRTIGGCVIAPPYGWMNIVKWHIFGKLKYFDRCPWIEYLCMQDDNSYMMTAYKAKEFQKHMIRIRNYARRYIQWESRIGTPG